MLEKGRWACHRWSAVAAAGPDAAGPQDSSLVSLGSLMLSGFLKGLHSPKVYVGVVRADLEAMAAMFLFIYPLSFSSYFNEQWRAPVRLIWKAFLVWGMAQQCEDMGGLPLLCLSVPESPLPTTCIHDPLLDAFACVDHGTWTVILGTAPLHPRMPLFQHPELCLCHHV